MKFFVTNDLKKNPTMESAVLAFLLLEALFVAGSIAMQGVESGFTPASVKAYYLGNEAEYIEGKGLPELLEEAHIQSFVVAVILLTACSLLAITNVSRATKLFLVYASFAGGALNIVGGLLVVYVSPAFAYVKLGASAAYWLGLVCMIALTLLHLLKRDASEEKRTV